MREITADRAKVLVASGMADVRKDLTDVVYTQSVKEHIFVVLDCSLTMNIRTEYVMGNERHQAVISTLDTARRELRACLRCILNGNASSCRVTTIGERWCAALTRTMAVGFTPRLHIVTMTDRCLALCVKA